MSHLDSSQVTTATLASGITLDPDTVWSINLLLILLAIGALIFLAIFLTNRRAGKKRYAAEQAKRTAAAATGRRSTLSDLADGTTTPLVRNVDGDGPPAAMPNARSQSIAQG